MPGARTRRQYRGQVEMTDPHVGQVVDKAGRVREGLVLGQLQPVGGSGGRPRRIRTHRRFLGSSSWPQDFMPLLRQTRGALAAIFLRVFARDRIGV